MEPTVTISLEEYQKLVQISVDNTFILYTHNGSCRSKYNGRDALLLGIDLKFQQYEMDGREKIEGYNKLYRELALIKDRNLVERIFNFNW